MIKKWFLFAIALIATLVLTVSCANDAIDHSDSDYPVFTPEFRRERVEIIFVFYDDLGALRDAARQQRIENFQRIVGFALWQQKRTGEPVGACEIHVVDPEKRRNASVLGHELLHCAYGRWHP